MKQQNNGFKIGMIVLFLGLSLWYLFPTLQNYLENRHIESLPESERNTYLGENREKLQRLQEGALSLGLDLQGGMYVTLEVGVEQLLRELAGEYADGALNEVLSEAGRVAAENST
ncbi:MAG: protein translocase subunit SecD, partial [Balneolaceae bacterium]